MCTQISNPASTIYHDLVLRIYFVLKNIELCIIFLKAYIYTNTTFRIKINNIYELTNETSGSYFFTRHTGITWT